MDSAAVVFWPFADWFAFGAILGLLRGDWWLALLSAAIAAAAVAAGYFIGTTGEGTLPLMLLAGFVGVFGLPALVIGLLLAEGTLWQRLQRPAAALGLDITAAMLGAFGLATAFADPPLF